MAPKTKEKSQPKEQDTEDVLSRNKAYKAPGRLGNPKTELWQDSRVNTKLLEVLSRYGLDRSCAPPSLERLNADSSMQQLGASMAEAEAGFEKLYEALPNGLASDAYELAVEEKLEIIPGPDGTQMKLFIVRPELRGGPLPCIVYLHQGGMTITRTMNKVNRRWLRSLAAQGMVAIAVDFRNATTPSGFNPFPAGLYDCCAAVKWIHSHKGELNIRNIVLQGDDGGANLALATAIKAKREGWAVQIDGVYACSPYISNAYNWPEEKKLSELPSLVECDGYFCNVDYKAYMARVYTSEPGDQRNPLAWPYYATAKDVEGLPPHVIVVDELSPLRDEGVAYYRKLSAAGTKVTGSVNLGHTHSATLIFRQAMAEDNRAAVRKIAAFAKSV